jgi:hypothetical protein
MYPNTAQPSAFVVALCDEGPDIVTLTPTSGASLRSVSFTVARPRVSLSCPTLGVSRLVSVTGALVVAGEVTVLESFR